MSDGGYESVTLVFLHGINNVPDIWLDIVAGLDTGFAVHRPLLEAHQTMTEVAEAAMVGVSGPFVLVGHSFGGYVALDVLARYGSQTRGIALINSSCGADSNEMRSARSDLAQRALQDEYMQLASAASHRTFHPDSLDRKELMIQREKDLVGYGAERFAAHQIASARRDDRSTILQDYDGEKLVIAASDDQVISLASQQAMATASQAQIFEVSGCGHMLPAEKPKQVSQILQSWLQTTVLTS
jgi:pimeloyl-ACP methyl ester carboxylesterase